MKKIIASGLVAILLVVITASHAWAYFKNEEDSCLYASTLDLSTGEAASQVYTFSMLGVLPGEAGCTSVLINNEGALDGGLSINFSTVTNIQNGQGEHINGTGELGDIAEIAIFIDKDGNESWGREDLGLLCDGEVYSNTDELRYSAINNYSRTFWEAVATLPAQTGMNVMVMWRVPFAAGNEIQGDSVGFDVGFQLW